MKLRNGNQSFLSTITSLFSGRQKSERSLIFVAAFAIVGAVAVLASFAATNSFSIDPESGNRTGNVSTGVDSAASGHAFLRFGPVYKDIFVSASGSDSNNGTTESLAVKSFARALQLASGPTRIRAMAGNYTETVRIQKNNIILEPYGNGDVTINGAIPEFINGVNWTYVQPGIYKYALGRDEYNSDGSNVIYGSDGQQQWTYPDIGQLSNRLTVNNLPGVFINNFLFANEVYVATSNGQPPTAPLYIGGTIATIDIYNANNITINGLPNSKLKLVYGSNNVRVRNSDGIKIDNVDITGGKAAVVATDTSNISVTSNNVHGTFGRNWDWADVKERPGTKTMENQAIFIKPINKNISNVLVSGNDVSGYFNGVNLSAVDDTYFVEDSTISNNRIHDALDDGIEIDSSYRNLVVKGNTVYDAYSPFSATGGAQGPVDVYENLFVANRAISDDFGAATSGPSYSIKLNNNQGNLTKNMNFYNNTFYFAGNSGNFRMTVHSYANYITSQVSFTNNIFYSYDGGIVRGSGRAEDGIEWDGNVFYSEKNDSTNYYAWNSLYDANHSYASLSSIVSAGVLPSQWQGNVEGNPAFNCVTPTNASCFRANSSITKPSTKQPIPGTFTESGRLNSRTRVGAFE